MEEQAFLPKIDYRLPATKIPWATHDWNPYWGCLNGCPYCYARNTICSRFSKAIAKREVEYSNQWVRPRLEEEPFELSLRSFNPVRLHHRDFPKLDIKKEHPGWRIFVNSMSDICWWDIDGIEHVFSIIGNNSKFNFIILTKDYRFPGRAVVQMQFPEPHHIMYFPNLFFGFTITTIQDLKEFGFWLRMDLSQRNYFFNLEPLLEPINIKALVSMKPAWIIVGALTGNDLSYNNITVEQKIHFLYDLMSEGEKAGIPVFVKDNMIKEIKKHLNCSSTQIKTMFPVNLQQYPERLL